MEMLTASDTTRARKRSRLNRSSEAYERIKELILVGELTASDVLSEGELADRLGMSRTPIREALRRLSQDHLVEIVPDRGAWVRDVSLNDLREIFDLRKVLEPLAAEQAVSRVPEEDIVAIEREWRALEEAVQLGEQVDYEVVSRLDNRFHNLIIAYCRNKRLRDFLELLNQEILRYQLLTAQTLANVEETVSQHLYLVTLFKARDIEALSRGLKLHIERSEEIVFSRR
jgi:DNA-binding GntR family transcriptional regulator